MKFFFNSINQKINFFYIYFLIGLLFQSLISTSHSICPFKTLIEPCKCYNKTKRLDIICEKTTLNQLKNAIDYTSKSNHLVNYFRILNSNLQIFPNYLFENLKITHLVINYNNLSLIEKNGFINSLENDLLSLDISLNQLTKIPTEALSVLSALISLDLNYNKIEYIEELSFKGLYSLVRLSLFGNKIKQIDANAFNGIGGNLTNINLGGNFLNKVPAHCLINLQTLNKLNLHENNISELKNDLFINFIENNVLDTIILSSNFVKIIPDRAFKFLVGLSSIDLSNNKIIFIENDAFIELEESIEWINLSENHLKEIPTEACKKLIKLRLLDIRSNSISYIKKDAFIEYGKAIKFLHLENNKIYMIEDGAFNELTSLEWLYLSSNYLLTISPKLINPIEKQLKVLDLHDNLFICNCELSWLVDFISLKRSIINLPKKTKCSLSSTNVITRLNSANFSFKSQTNFNKTFDYLISNQKIIKKKMTLLKNKLKEEIELTEMKTCSSSQPINYKYHLYCLILSFIMVHVIYYYLGLLGYS